MQTVTLDEVRDISASLALKESHTASHSFYEFAIPLKELQFTPDPLKPITGDIGIITGNGTETTGRTYWHNKRMTIVTDIPTEASLYPQHWGKITFTKTE